MNDSPPDSCAIRHKNWFFVAEMRKAWRRRSASVPRGRNYETFPPAEARRSARKLEFHYTPRHGSWLNMAEIELSILPPHAYGAGRNPPRARPPRLRLPLSRMRSAHMRGASHPAWIDGGRTMLSNLTLLCRRHHRAVHEEGFGVKMTASGEITFTRPDGQPLPDAAPAPQIPEAGVDRLITAHQELGLDIDPWTSVPHWHGERLDLDYAIRALRR